MLRKVSKKTDAYASISILPGTAEELRVLHEEFAPYTKFYGFMAEVAAFYRKHHCPECKASLKSKSCSCKEPESF